MTDISGLRGAGRQLEWRDGREGEAAADTGVWVGSTPAVRPQHRPLNSHRWRRPLTYTEHNEGRIKGMKKLFIKIIIDLQFTPFLLLWTSDISVEDLGPG